MKPEIIIGISSVFIALCAFLISIWQGMQVRKHNKLSFRPHLDTWTHTNGQEGHFALLLVNNGIGPAEIEKITITVDGHEIGGPGTFPIDHAISLIFPPRFKRATTTSYLSKWYCLGSKEKCVLVELRFKIETIPTPEEFKRSTERANIRIEYKSFYGEKYTLDSSEKKTNN